VGTTEDQLRHEAETQRERMGDTLEAIGDRLSPERMVERRKAAVGKTFRNMKESVMGSPGYQEPATERLRAQGGDVRDTATSAVQNAAEHVQQAPQALADQARGNPVAAGIIAFGAGVLLATLLPSSRTEQRVVADAKPQLQQAAQQLKHAGQDVATEAKDHARDAAEEVKSSSTEAGSHVREQAEESAHRVKDDAGS
jgi:gas vesicle protein